ncbi:MAG TPA: hypothetical protein VMZ32_02250 [Gammaproteobacteria bacterium]|nr:hypothetical protein [Gammaproteobacteria bacterium]
MRELRHPRLFANYRRCPHCGDCFTVDPDTKRRQAVCIVIALISLLFTVLLYFGDDRWLIPALVSYAVLVILIYHGNKRVFLVPWSENEKRDG